MRLTQHRNTGRGNSGLGRYNLLYCVLIFIDCICPNYSKGLLYTYLVPNQLRIWIAHMPQPPHDSFKFIFKWWSMEREKIEIQIICKSSKVVSILYSLARVSSLNGSLRILTAIVCCLVHLKVNIISSLVSDQLQLTLCARVTEFM